MSVREGQKRSKMRPIWLNVCVCVCVCERERERAKVSFSFERKKGII